jgi:sugar-specific transcriptional regulator TrmB
MEKARIPRESVYRTMPMLEKMGLVEKNINNPTMYKAVPLKDVISLLMEQRTRETHELQEITSKLVENFKENDSEKTLQQEETQFTLIYGPEAFGREMNKAVSTARKSFEGITTPMKFRNGMFNGGKNFKNAVKRGVKFRHIVSENEEEGIELNDVALRRNPLWEVRYSVGPLQVDLAIIDGKKVIMETTPNQTKKTCCLVSNSPCLVIMAQSYFDIIWGMAKKLPVRSLTVKAQSAQE